MSTSSRPTTRIEERDRSSEERALRRYFREIPESPSLQRERWQLIAGAAAACLGLLFFGGSAEVMLRWVLGPILIAGGGVTIVCNFYRIWMQRYRYQLELRQIFPRPSDREVEVLLRERLEKLKQHSLHKLGIFETEKGVEPLSISQGILWYTSGIAPEDLVWRQGTDGIPRYGVYRVVILWLTNHRLAAFACDYNFLRDAPVNEEIDELYYQDVVSISVKEDGSSLTLPTGESITTVQRLCIAVANGSFFIVTVGSSDLRRVTGVEQPPSSDIERTLAAVRMKVDEKKRALEGPASRGRAASLR